ncbi:MAG: hypothetical protein AAGB16_04685 [Pseudomonadota bacterium]
MSIKNIIVSAAFVSVFVGGSWAMNYFSSMDESRTICATANQPVTQPGGGISINLKEYEICDCILSEVRGTMILGTFPLLGGVFVSEEALNERAAEAERICVARIG